jgi:hypothetical protein
VSDRERSQAVPVTGPVVAWVGPVHLRLFPYEHLPVGVDESEERPWAWGAMVRVKFRIGELVTSKKVRQRYAYYDGLGWPRQSRPTDNELATGRETVLANLREQVTRHGFEPPEFVVIEAASSDDADAADG